MKSFRLLLFSFITCIAWCVCAQDSTRPAQWLMPKPKNITENGTVFDLQRTVRLTDPTSSTLLASLFTTSDEGTATVTVNLVNDATLGTFDYALADFDNEGYKLSVNAEAITITAASKTGVIRAAQTLMQLAAAADGASIQGVEITDYPAFKLRGFMHDVGRSFISFDELKKEIDLLSRFKVNVFHWHMTDNQGFRFESKLYPKLNKAASMTRFAGKYYTQAQCTELEAYAAERGVIIIPEIDMPGHSTAFTTAMGYTMSSDQGRVVLKKLLGELATAFPLAPYIHIGADEAGTTAAFVNEMSQYIKEKLGRRCVVWNPISGVSISTSTLPYIDMTEMWSTAGKKISGVPNIDCRYNYVNHFDVFADLVGIYKSNIYYAQQGNRELAGAITALWNDRKTPTETDIICQNNLYANALATAERGWMGGGKQYIEVGGTTLPNIGSEYDEFADWERRFLYYKDTWLSGEPIPYVKQTNVRWRITEPFPDAQSIYPPEEATDDILPATFTYNGQAYGTGLATGAGIYLRHTWGTTVPAYFSNPQLNTKAYAWTYIYSPIAQTAGALIEFQNYGRSENDKAPDARKWDRKGSQIYLNGEEIMPPTWINTGKEISSEVDLRNENFAAREPISVQLREGWNKVFLKLPYASASGVRLNKWLFTFVLTTSDGRKALDNIVYSPTKTMNFEDEEIPRALSSDPLPELEGKVITMSKNATANVKTEQWYVMYNRGNDRGYLWENAGSHTLFNTATAPSSAASTNAKYLVRLIDAPDGKYYLQTGFGNYFGKIQQSVNVPVTANPTEAITVAKINNSIGHFYLRSAEGVILDANDLSLGDSRATVVGWGTTVPTSLNGNNDWAFYPIEVADASNISFTADDVTVCQGHQTAGLGNAMQALLRVKVAVTTVCTPTRFDITLTGAEQMSRVAVYATDIDQLHAPAEEGHAPLFLGAATPADGDVSIPVNMSTLTNGQKLYFWITADVKETATELSTIDAALKAIAYDNPQGGSTCDLQEKGNPTGVMRIYKRQQFLWTGSQSRGKYYRIPTIMRTADGGIVALCDDRYDNTQDLGKVASGAAGKHKIDVVMRKSMDDGATWGDAQVIAAGDGSSAAACGYGDPAIVRTLSGKLVCLMAAGSTSFPNGLLHMGYSESTDNGATWSKPKDIYSSIKKNKLSITSAFTSSGKGVTFSNGRIAFALNATVSGVCNEYILYSDDEGATWNIAPNMACASADESKLEIMNDNSLLLSVRQGGWNSQANRAYSRTEGDASGDGINSWGTKNYWTDLNANGCNADLLYYTRATEGNGARDLLLHTVVKTFQTYRRDLRLYMSFDQGTTWQEAFQLQPGYAAYSSMQKLANGDLAIIFEDGSLGNQDKMDCYAMTYLVISRETLMQRADEVWQHKQETANMVKIVYENSKETELGKWDVDNTSGRNIWTSTVPPNPIAGLTLKKSAGTFDRYTGWNGFYNLAYKVGAANRNEVLTLTAPDGYLIQSYSFQVQEWSSGASANDFTITAADGTRISPAYKGGADGYTLFDIKDVQAKSTSFTVRSKDATKYLAIINFVVKLTPEEDGIGALTVPPANAGYYNLAGQRLDNSLLRPGIYIKEKKKVIVR